MKKMFGKRLAFLLAATLLAAGIFISRSENEDGDDEITGAAATLPEPSGTDPFKNGYYKPKSEWWPVAFGSSFLFMNERDFVKFDTTARTMELLDDDKEICDESALFKYTYNETNKTVTMAASKAAIPADISKFIESCINDTDYEKGYKLASLSEFLKFIDTFYANKDWRNWLLEEHPEHTQEDLDEMKDEAKDVCTYFFNTSRVYKYTTNTDGSITLTLTDPEPENYEESTTLQFVEQ